MKKKIAILGSTGSIGKSTIDILRKDKKNFDIVLLTTNNNYREIYKQYKEFKVRNIVINNNKHYSILKKKFKNKKINIYNNFDSFKKNGSKNYDLLRSSPVIQASLNITCDKMISDMTHAENFLQRLGRLDRFGENDEANNYVIAITEAVKKGKAKDNSSRFLSKLNSLGCSKAWFEYLQKELPGKEITINQIYGLYDDFYKDPSCRQLVEQDLIAALKDSFERLRDKLDDPITLRTSKNKGHKIKIKKQSLRGDNRFVQMAVCRVIDRNNHNILNEYAYPETESEESFSYGVEVIKGYGDSGKNLLSFMAKKHHNIKNVKKVYKDSQLLNEARNPDTPIYLSYTPEDLKMVEAQPNPFAVYYAEGNNQPIGAISINNLNREEQ